MSESGTGFYWITPLLEARKKSAHVVITLKANTDAEIEGVVEEVNQGLVTLKDPDDDDIPAIHILLDEISAVVIEKGEED